MTANLEVANRPLPDVPPPWLRPYQRAAVEAVEHEWLTERATMVAIATGLGKTVIAADLVRRRGDHGRTLWIAHREELLQQARTALMRAGLSVEIERAEERAAILSLTPSDVVVASIQSMCRPRRLDVWRKHASQFGTIVVDECHHAPARGYREVLKAFPEAKVLGLTATPDRSDEIAMGTVFDSVAYRMGIMDGIAQRWLAPITARTVTCEALDLDQVKVRMGDLVAEQLDELITRDKVLHQIAAPLCELSIGRPTLVFTPGVDSARELGRVLAGYVGADQVGMVDGGQTREERAKVLGAYAEGRLRFVTNCMVLTEGFDAPHTSCIAIARPTKSRALYAQMVGRGTRLHPGKTDMLLLDFTGKSKVDLVGPADLLGGEYELPAETLAKVKDALESGEARSLEEILAQAEQDAAARATRQLREQMRARLRGIARYHVGEMQLLGAGPAHIALAEEIAALSRGAKGTGNPELQATPKQRDYLERFGVALPKTAGKWTASRAIDAMRARGVCTLRQAKTLARAGLRTDIGVDEASRAIDALSAAGWTVTEEIKAKWGPVSGACQQQAPLCPRYRRKLWQELSA